MTDPELYTDAERTVLSAMMHGAAEAAAERLTPADFYLPKHGVMYDHLLELWGAREPTDPPALLKRLADRGELTKSDTAGYLHEIYALHAEPMQVGYYASIVLQGSEQRRLSALAARLSQAVAVADPDARQERVTAVLAELAAAERPAGSGKATTWDPMDLGPYLDGTVDRPEPNVGIARADGLRVLYPGKEHAVIGEMESGKSWFSLACVASELVAGRNVVYIHFEEDDPADTVDRLRLLGVPAYQIRTQLRFVGPHAPATPEQVAKLAACRPSLVVLDGQNEGMILHGQEIREETGAGLFRQVMVKPWTAIGAAVLACDHVTKSKEDRGRYALGSVHKGNALNGSLIVLENAEPFGRGERGVSRVYVVKDRPGHLRRHGQKTAIPGKTYLGTLVVDDTRRWRDELDLQWHTPADVTPDDAPAEKTNPAAAWVARVLAGEPEQAIGSKKQLLAALRANGYKLTSVQLDPALDDLTYAGTIEEVPGKRGAIGFRMVAPDSPTQPVPTSSADSLPRL